MVLSQEKESSSSECTSACKARLYAYIREKCCSDDLRCHSPSLMISKKKHRIRIVIAITPIRYSAKHICLHHFF